MQHRIEYIDRLKGFAILCVIIGHIPQFCFGMTNDPVHDFVYLYHMPLFIFLSGLVMSSAPSVKKAVGKSIQFLSPFFIIGYFAYSLGLLGMSFSSFMSEHFKGGYWYLLMLAYMYILAIPFRWSDNDQGKKKIIKDALVFTIDTAIIKGLSCLVPHYTFDMLGLTLVQQYWPFFMLGFLTRRYNLTSWLSNQNWMLTLCMLSIIPLSIAYFSGIGHAFTPLAFAFVAGLTYLFRKREGQSSIIENELARIGKGSLDVYIFHYFILHYIHLKSIGGQLEGSDNMFIVVMLIIILAIPIAYICVWFGILLRQSKFMENIVYGNWFKRITTKTM